MYLLESLLILLWMLIVPVCIGMLIINQLFKEKKTDFLLALVCGMISMLAIFYLLVMPMLFLHVPLHILVICWSILVALICFISLIFNRKRFKEILGYNFCQIKSMSFINIVVIVFVLIQALILVLYAHEDLDDAFYVANASTAVVTDSIFQFDPYTGNPFFSYPSRYVLSPFSIFIALISKLTLIHPTIVAHTIFPAVFIPLSYVIFTLLGKKLFPNQPSAVPVFIFFLCILNVFGNFSVYTNSTFLLFRIWQGKSILANIIIPSILYFSFRTMIGNSRFGEWMMLFVCAMCACLVSSIGIALAPLLIVSMGTVFAVRNKKFRILTYSVICCVPCIACGVASVIL